VSGSDEAFFSRWSRRKLEERSAEAAPPAAPVPAAPEPPAELPADAPDAERSEAGEPEPLPPIEELTAESDISAFLRKGVPAALKNAALRRVWSLDPFIRDYVGPAEYAWDYNTPGAMAGFGAADASMGEHLRQTVANIRAVSVPSAPQPSPEAAPMEPAPAEQLAAAVEAPGTAPSPPAEPPPTATSADASEEPSSAGPVTAPSGEESVETPEPPQRPPRHGSALPRW
jgi:hypothetical protein